MVLEVAKKPKFEGAKPKPAEETEMNSYIDPGTPTNFSQTLHFESPKKKILSGDYEEVKTHLSPKP